MEDAGIGSRRRNGWQHRAAPWFEKLTIGQLVDRAAERRADREALGFEGRRWSFAEFRDETDRSGPIDYLAMVEEQPPDARLSEVPVVFVVASPGAELREQDVVGLCRGRIASFKIPRRLYVVDQVPMTGSGKIQKYLLREEAARSVQPGAVYAT